MRRAPFIYQWTRPAMTSETAQSIARHLPFVRRYARALSGDQRSGDELVRAALERLLREEGMLDHDAIKVSLYRAVSRVWADQAVPASQSGQATIENAAIVAKGIARLDDTRRQILILSTLEGFSPAQVGAIVGRSENEVQAELVAGKRDLRQQPPTQVLIIEDEPVIALDMGNTLELHGHKVTGIATTHREAVDLARAEPPGLVLADIHLGDDSSGIDAVAEILEHYRVPVIFITAFPDRLLTGERTEPTFLITKPFDPEILSVAISQAIATYRG
jgi:DNA-directed RNA polymerase specialized sigma24 family protein/CheY-like chemotaxis protein